MSLLEKDLYIGNLLVRVEEAERRIRELLKSALSPGRGDERYRPTLVQQVIWDPANIATDGAVTSTTVTVPGAQPAHVATASHDQIGTNDVLISAHVQADDTVRVVVMNKSGGALNIGSGTLTVHVRQ